MRKPSIFISYSSRDREQAETIHHHLDSFYFEVWRDQTRLEIDWSREIANALSQSDVLCLIWSEYAARSKWVRHEWLTARALEKYILVCLLPNAPNLPGPLHNLHAIKLVPSKGGLMEIVRRLTKQVDIKVIYEYNVLPPNFYIPFNPNPEFTGRENDLMELYLKMIGNLNKIGINQVGTVGMGGIGKTQLVVEFAYRYSFAFHSVHWIQATKIDGWAMQFVNLAKNDLQLQVKDSEGPDADKRYLFALRNYFKEHPSCLIVMDNVEDPELLNNDTLLFGLTALSLGCNLLFTTRSEFHIPGVTAQPINILSKEAAYSLLTKYRLPSTLVEKENAEAILNAVGYLPLAIILLGAYLREYESEISFADYRVELRNNKLDTLDIGETSPQSLATRHIAAVRKTLENQWKMLQNNDAKFLLELAGQLGEAEIIPKARLGLLAGIEVSKNNLLRPLAKAFNQLHKLNLVERMDGIDSGIRLHPLIHDFAKTLVKGDQLLLFKATAAMNLKVRYFQYAHLEKEILARGVYQIEDDLQIAIDWWGNDNTERQEIELLHGALRRSSNTLLKDDSQLVSQLLGRLINQESKGIRLLLIQAIQNKKGIWLRPISGSLADSGFLIRTLEGHTGGVNAIAIHPDGLRAVSASNDYTLKVWNLRSYSATLTLEGHSNYVNAVAIHPDGKRIVSGSSDNSLKVWDLEIGKEILSFVGHDNFVQAVAIHPDGKRVVSASWDHTLKVWDLETGHEIFALRGHKDYVNAVAIHPNGKWAISASWDRTLKIWDLQTGSEILALKGHNNNVSAVAMHPDGSRAISASWDSTIKVWDLKTGREILFLEGHNNFVHALAVFPGRGMAISALEDNTLDVWDLKTGNSFLKFEGHDGYVKAVAIHPDGRRCVSASADHTLKVWDLQANKDVLTIENNNRRISTIAIHPDGKRALSLSDDKSLKVWDLGTGKVILILKDNNIRVNAVAFHPDGRRALSAFDDSTLKLWDLQTGKAIYTLEGHRFAVNSINIHPDGRRAISISEDNTLIIWNLRTGTKTFTYLGYTGRVCAVAIHPQGRRAVSISEENILKIWDLQAGTETLVLKGHSGPVNAVAVHPDELRAISASDDHTLNVWDLEIGKVILTLEGHSGPVNAVAVHPDELRAVSASDDYTLNVWDLDTGTVILALEGHSGPVNAVAISPDGRHSISSSHDGTLRLWDLENGTNVATFFGNHALSSFAFVPYKNLIISGDTTGQMHFLVIEGLD